MRLAPVRSMLCRLSLMALLLPTNLMAYAVVESRTGEPANRSSAASPQSYSAPTAKPQGYGGAKEGNSLSSLRQVETLQQEISELRGLIETQEHEIQQLKKSQQSFYVDLDKRLNQFQQTQNAQPASKDKSLKAASGGSPTLTAATNTAKAGASATAPAILEAKPDIKPSKSLALETSSPSADGKSSTKSTTTNPVNGPQELITGIPKTNAAKKQSTGEKEAFETAYNLVRSKQYSEAIASLQNFLTRFPKGEYAGNAHYWLGEVYMVQWQGNKTNTILLDNAAEAFSAITDQFPQHPKVTDALLKLGLIESDKGNTELARQYFIEVRDRFPGSAAARIAESRLQQLNP